MNVRDGNDPFTSIKISPEVLESLSRRLTAIERSADTL